MSIRPDQDCAGCMAAVLQRLDALRVEIKADLRDATTPIWQEIKTLGVRVSTVETTQAQQQGGSKVWAAVGGAAVTLAAVVLGAVLSAKFGG